VSRDGPVDGYKWWWTGGEDAYLYRSLWYSRDGTVIEDILILLLGTNMDRHNPVNTRDRFYPYPNRTVSIIMCLIRMTPDYPNFLRTKKMALAAIFLWPLHQYHILTRHIDIF